MANVQRLQQLLKTVTAFSDNFTYRCTLAIIPHCPVGPKSKYHKDASWTGPTTSNFETALKLLVQDNTMHTCGSCGCMIGFTNALLLESCKVNSFDCDYDELESAKNWLDLTNAEREFLFYPQNLTRYSAPHDYLSEFSLDENFPGWEHCTHEVGLKEGLRRLQFLIDYHSNPPQPS
jgi:hypothetical protein